MNNSRTELRTPANALDNNHHSEGGLSDCSQPTLHASSPNQHQALPVIASRNTLDDIQNGGEWPLTLEEEHRVEAEAVEATTPRKSIKTEQFNTPGKSGNIQYNNNGMPTPETGGTSLRRNLFGNPTESLTHKRKADNEFLDLVSPASTPTPTRFRDVEGRMSDAGLFKDIALALQSSNVYLDDEATRVVKQVCSRYDRKAEGISQG
jgi:hypothetical protein